MIYSRLSKISTFISPFPCIENITPISVTRLKPNTVDMTLTTLKQIEMKVGDVLNLECWVIREQNNA